MSELTKLIASVAAGAIIIWGFIAGFGFMMITDLARDSVMEKYRRNFLIISAIFAIVVAILIVIASWPCDPQFQRCY